MKVYTICTCTLPCSTGEEQNNYDAFMLMEATKEVVDVVKRNYMNWRVAQRYARYFVPDKAPISTEAVRLEYVAERRKEMRECLLRDVMLSRGLPCLPACFTACVLCVCSSCIFEVVFLLTTTCHSLTQSLCCCCCPGARGRTSSAAITPSRMLSRASSAKMLSLRFEDIEEAVGKEKEGERGEDEVEEVELAESPEGEDIEELRGFMFRMLKALLFDLVVGEAARH
jgi:hypothetical protein